MDFSSDDDLFNLNSDEKEDKDAEQNEFFNSGDEEDQAGNEARKKTIGIEDLIRRRLEMIANSPAKSMASKLLILDQFYPPRENSIIFNAMYPVEKEKKIGETAAEKPREVLVEVSLQSKGFSVDYDTVVYLKDDPALPRCEFFIADPDTSDLFAVVYQKIFDAADFDLYFRKNGGEAINFLCALKILIDRLHERKIILPPCWDEKGILGVGCDKLPVLTGYNNTVAWHDEKEFLAGCEGDWMIFMTLVVDLEDYAPDEHSELFEKLGKETYAKIEALAATQ
jgi:hypothetical protein